MVESYKEIKITREFFECQIDNKPIDDQIHVLFDEAVKELDKPSIPRRVCSAAAIVFGIISGYIYIEPTLRLTKNDTLAYSYFAVTSTTLTNIVVNIYFNLDAVLRLFSLKDPLTQRRTVSTSELIFNSGVSLVSAFAFAFLGLEDRTAMDYSFFFILLFTYASQHFFSIMDLTSGIHELPCFASKSEAAIVKKILNKKINRACSSYMKGLEEKGSRFAIQFYEEEKLNTYQLNEWMFQLPGTSLEDKPILQGLPKLIYWTTQSTSFFAQIIGNIGYYNSAINGFNFYVPITWAWVLGTANMAPLYALGFILSYQNVAKITELLINVISKVKQRQFKDILKELPYTVRRAPRFSLLVGSIMTTMAIFSFFTSVTLFIEAVYDANADDPKQFSWIDSGEQARSFYTELTRYAAICFNIFPVPEVLGFLSRQFCLLTDSLEEKQAIKVMMVLESVERRASKIPLEAFSTQEDFLNEEPRRRENPCTRLMNWLSSGCGLWRRQPSLQENNSDLQVNLLI